MATMALMLKGMIATAFTSTVTGAALVAGLATPSLAQSQGQTCVVNANNQVVCGQNQAQVQTCVVDANNQVVCGRSVSGMPGVPGSSGADAARANLENNSWGTWGEPRRTVIYSDSVNNGWRHSRYPDGRSPDTRYPDARYPDARYPGGNQLDPFGRSASQNFVNLYDDVDRLYQDILGRPVDRDGLRTYADRIQRGGSLGELRRELARSPEGEQALNRLYQEVLGRTIDGGGYKTYRRRLEQDWSLRDVRRDISNSDEARNRRP
jgi:hypothetical protein